MAHRQKFTIIFACYFKIGKHSRNKDVFKLERNSTSIANYIFGQGIEGSQTTVFIKVSKSEIPKYTGMGFEKVLIKGSVVNYSEKMKDEIYEVVISRFKNKNKDFIKNKITKITEDFKIDFYIKISESKNNRGIK